MKALQPEILMNERGKFIPFIFIEWVHLRNNSNFPQYKSSSSQKEVTNLPTQEMYGR